MLQVIRRTLVISLMSIISAIVTAQGFEPSPAQKWIEFFCLEDEICEVGDVNGDGMDDIISFVHQEGVGAVWVGLSNGNGFITPQSIANEIFCLGGEICDVGDFNGDGKDDLIAFSYQPTNGTVFVGLANNNAKFAKGESWHNVFCLPDELCLVGDVDGDGQDDIIAMGTNMGNLKTWVSLSQGNSFGEAQLWGNATCGEPFICELADVNGDGKDDLVEFMQSDEPYLTDGGLSIDPGNVRVALSSGVDFANKEVWYAGFCVFTEAICTTGDVDGDDDADILMFLRDSEPNLIGFDQRRGRVDVALSDRAKFGTYSSQYAIMCIGEETCAVGDFNGDGKDDIGAFVKSTKLEPEMGDVWVATSIIDPANPNLTVISNIQGIQPTPIEPQPTQSSVVVVPSLQPLETTNPPSTPVATIAPQSNSNLDLVAGDTVIVTGTVTNRNMRTGPGSNFQIIEALPANIVMVILEGSVENEGVHWWRVAHYSESTSEGWIPEGNGIENWLTEVKFE
jgi:hypothetical protein